MGAYLRLARFYLALLAIFAVGRWLLGTSLHVPYEKATDKLSIVIMTIFASVFHAAFCRKWRGFGILDAIAFGALLGFLSQVVIFGATIASYVLGLQTYFNHPIALNSDVPLPFSAAIARRAGGLLGGVVSNGLFGAVGWLLGSLLPDRSPASRKPSRDAAGSR
jgi:hypothetical protein